MPARTDEESGPTAADRRSYYRVRVSIPLRHRRVRSDELEALRSEIRTPRQDADSLEPDLALRLKRLEHKLDLVLSYLDERIPAPLGLHDLRLVELSGAGMRFAAKDVAEEGEYEFLEFQLPGDPSGSLRALGRVVRSFEPEVPGDVPEVAVAFETIDEDDREAVVRFSNEVQRHELRARSAQREGE